MYTYIYIFLKIFCKTFGEKINEFEDMYNPQLHAKLPSLVSSADFQDQSCTMDWQFPQRDLT